MKIAVLNGSPKDKELSISIKYIEFLQKKLPNYQYFILPISTDINKIESNDSYFQSILKTIEDSDVVVWAYPVYFFMIPSQLKKFVELIFKKNKQNVFTGKYSTTITTSSMIFDYHAHNYIHSISEDLGMHYINGISFESIKYIDLLNKEYQMSFINFFVDFIQKAENKQSIPKKYFPISNQINKIDLDIKIENINRNTNKNIVILTDNLENSNIEKMVNIFSSFIKYKIDIVNVNTINIKKECSGCLYCQEKSVCCIQDDVREIFEKKLPNADAIIFAFSIEYRHLTARWKALIDRSTFNAQLPLLKRKICGWLVSGNLRYHKDLSEFIEIFSGAHFLNCVGIVSDEYDNTEKIVELIQNLANDVEKNIENQPIKPFSSYAQTYHLLVREQIASLGAAKYALYKHFRKHKLLKFPYSRPLREIIFFNIIFNLPFIKMIARKKLLNFLIKPYLKLLK
ncbi:MAG: hypothetical protein A2086_14620 [Spirochaetes bacterium GWD1_27_9]|nr:MAG: hypothetical protein A2Z98_04780 [Spirochaetes bacterium GWB1_27_13]OHD24955.1 MAG: hypothetical protein A2Y34_06245 [Spirochaetes bacterium GWC1_27_15]OHD38541.1 MAG: hypothetical protein A2086_14620 [Spirochaetes bacterium GWD1_27_9]